jgi:hypothetical protein
MYTTYEPADTAGIGTTAERDTKKPVGTVPRDVENDNYVSEPPIQRVRGAVSKPFVE